MAQELIYTSCGYYLIPTLSFGDKNAAAAQAGAARSISALCKNTLAFSTISRKINGGCICIHTLLRTNPCRVQKRTAIRCRADRAHW